MARRRKRESRQVSEAQVFPLRGLDAPQRKNRLTVETLIANHMRQMRDAVSITRTGTPVRRFDYRDIEDLRHYNAENGTLRSDVYRLVDGRRASYGYGSPSHHYHQPGRAQDRLRFFEPARTIVCRRRYARRRVLFALRRTGSGGARRNRAARWSARSYVQCK